MNMNRFLLSDDGWSVFYFAYCFVCDVYVQQMIEIVVSITVLLFCMTIIHCCNNRINRDEHNTLNNNRDNYDTQ